MNDGRLLELNLPPTDGSLNDAFGRYLKGPGVRALSNSMRSSEDFGFPSLKRPTLPPILGLHFWNAADVSKSAGPGISPDRAICLSRLLIDFLQGMEIWMRPLSFI